MAKRQAKRLEPITLDDLLNSSSMEGLVSFLDLPAQANSDTRPAPVGTLTSQPVSTGPIDRGTENRLLNSFNFEKELSAPVARDGLESRPTVPSDPASIELADSDFSPLSILGPSLETFTVPPSPTVDSAPLSTDYRNLLPRDDQASYSVYTDTGYGSRWVTEDGQVVSQKQVVPFRLAQDALNPNERALYQVLWNAREAKPFNDDPNVKLIRIGYDTMARQSNMAKKTIQRLIPRLISKGFIEVAQAPDFLNRTASTYRVNSFRKVLDGCRERGRTHIAKLGHGISFVRSRRILLNVDSDPLSTAPTEAISTVVAKSPKTVVRVPPPTMVRKSSFLEIASKKQESGPGLRPDLAPNRTTSSSSSCPNDIPRFLVDNLRSLMTSHHTELDTEAVTRLWNECRKRVPDCTPDEILHFSQAKALLFSTGKINNPVGFLLFAVPKCFEGPSFDQFRRERYEARMAEIEQTKRAEEEMQEVRRQLLAILNNPESTDDDRRFAERLLRQEES